MFNKNTVIILGAGASQEAGLPIGSELTEKIAKLITPKNIGGMWGFEDAKVDAAVRHLSSDGNSKSSSQFIKSAQEVADAMQLALSIDTFLETHVNNDAFVVLGKLGIVRAISQQEARCKMRPTAAGRVDFVISELADTWYYSLARQLFSGIPFEEPERAFENVSFIVFNYDRCLEHFLRQALQTYFRIGVQRAVAIVESISIVHPYGSLGSIFQTSERIDFADQNFDLIDAVQKIKTFSESVDSVTSHKIQQMVLSSERLVFLGFAFHQQNMDLMDNRYAKIFPDESFQSNDAYATTYGMSESDASIVEDMISYLVKGTPYDAVHPWIYTQNGTCSDLFSNYWRSLTR